MELVGPGPRDAPGRARGHRGGDRVGDARPRRAAHDPAPAPEGGRDPPPRARAGRGSCRGALRRLRRRCPRRGGAGGVGAVDELEAAVSRVELQAKQAPLRLERMWGQQAEAFTFSAAAVPGAAMRLLRRDRQRERPRSGAPSAARRGRARRATRALAAGAVAAQTAGAPGRSPRPSGLHRARAGRLPGGRRGGPGRPRRLHRQATQHGGSFVYDPWVLYGRRVLTDRQHDRARPAGLGQERAEQELSRCASACSAASSRTSTPRASTAPLVEAMGGVVLRLEPGGRVRLNPLTRIGTREMREGLLEAVTRAMLDRPLAQAEAVGLVGGAGGRRTATAGGAEVVHPRRHRAAARPERARLAERAHGHEPGRGARGAARVRAGAASGCARARWRGMFDGPTTAGRRTSGTRPRCRWTCRRSRAGVDRRRPRAGDHDGLRDGVPGRQARRAQARRARRAARRPRR